MYKVNNLKVYGFVQNTVSIAPPADKSANSVDCVKLGRLRGAQHI